MDKIAWIASGGSKGYVAVPEWCREQRELGIKCGHCDGVRPDAIHRLGSVVVGRVLPRVVIGSVSPLWGGLIIESDIAELIGKPKLEELCLSVPVYDSKGTHLRNFRYYIEKVQRGAWRGSVDSKIGTCKECGRLLYWPVPRPYLLEQYWDPADAVTVIHGKVVSTLTFARGIVGAKQYSTLEVDTRDVQSEPEDGLPSGYEDMVAEIIRRGWLR